MVDEDKDTVAAQPPVSRTQEWAALRDLEDALAPFDKVEALLATLSGSASQIYDDSGLNNVNLLQQSIDVAVHQLHNLVDTAVEKLDVLFALHRKRFNLPFLEDRSVTDTLAIASRIHEAFKAATQTAKVAKIESVVSKPKKKAAKKATKKVAKRRSRPVVCK